MTTKRTVFRGTLSLAMIAGAALCAIPAVAANTAASSQQSTPGGSSVNPVPDPQGPTVPASTELSPSPTTASTAPSLTSTSNDTSAPVKPTATAGKDISAGDTAHVAVSVATLWTKPTSPRSIDAPALRNPVDLEAWNKALKTTQLRRDLTGLTQTQALYGDAVTVLETKGTWSKVSVTRQPEPGSTKGYRAWVPTIQLVKNDRFTTQTGDAAVATVTVKQAALRETPGGAGKPTVTVPLNTELPALASTDDEVRVGLPNGAMAWVKSSDVDVRTQGEPVATPTGADLVKTAKQFLGLRYLWGGASASGFDCSGFTYSIYRAHGITIARDADPQSTGGTSVKTANLKPGDLLFFAQPGGTGKVHHVGMYVGGGKMIHSPNASKSVMISDWRAWDSSNEFAGAKRYL